MATDKPDILWEGASGKKYNYWIHKIGTSFVNKPGNYIYAKETSPRKWKPVYIGETGSLAERLANHEREECALNNGATHIHGHTSTTGRHIRLVEEADLIEKWKPACNK